MKPSPTEAEFSARMKAMPWRMSDLSVNHKRLRDIQFHGNVSKRFLLWSGYVQTFGKTREYILFPALETGCEGNTSRSGPKRNNI